MKNVLLEIRIALLEAILIDSIEKKERYFLILEELKKGLITSEENSQNSQTLVENLEQHRLKIDKIDFLKP